MIEKTVELNLVEGIKKLGGLCFKFVSPGNLGVPDRLIILPEGRIVFAELKIEVGRLSKIQAHTVERMRGLGAEVRVLYGLKDVKEFLAEIAKERDGQ